MAEVASIPYMPQPVTTVEVAMGATDTSKLMPAMSEIPDEFKNWNHPWSRWQSAWFFKGLDGWPVAKQDIDSDRATRHLTAIQRSFQPSHEHKAAAVAYLASLWFESP